MSFFQKYLTSNKKKSGAELSPKNAVPVDPTSRVASHHAKPSSLPKMVPKAKTAAATDAPSAASIMSDLAQIELELVPARRVQIFNESETFAPDDSLELKVYPKDEETKTCLFSALMLHFLFETLSEKELTQIIDCMKPMEATAGQVVIKQGDPGDLFYCLMSGTASACVNDDVEVMIYQKGSCFGELALLYNCPRAASVIARTECFLWTLDLKTFRNILASTSSNTMAVRCEFLSRCPFLEHMSHKQITKLAGALDITYYDAGDYILKQGESGDSFYIIEEGTVKCTQKKTSGREFELISLKEGDYFGEMALMLNERRHANCIAVTFVKCLSLNRAKFDMLMGQARQLMAKRMRVRILQSVPLLAKLSENKLLELASVMKVQSFPDGAFIIKEGEEGSRFYIINEGEVRCMLPTREGVEPEEVARLYPQQFFGERALVTNEARAANIIACGPVECLVLDRTSFQVLLADLKTDITDEMTARETDLKKEGENSQRTSNFNIEDFLIDGHEFTNHKLEDLKIMRTVGTGTFGRVKVVQHLDGSMYALKCMNKAEIVALHQEKNTLAEKNLLHDCAKCPFVLQLFQTFNRANQIFMLTEFVQGGELWSYIYEKKGAVPRAADGGFDVNAVKFYAANVVLAFKYMHSKGISYRDLKPENLLVNHDGYIKVIDFGFAKKLPYMKRGVEMDKSYTLCGTPEYLAPEIILSKGYDKNVDYWALGCLIYEMIYNHTPFQAEYTSKIFQHIVASERYLKFGLKGSEDTISIIRGLLCPNPSFRLGNLSAGIKGIMDHSFFSDVDWQVLCRRQVAAPYVPVIKGDMDASNFNIYEEEGKIPVYNGSEEHFDLF